MTPTSDVNRGDWLTALAAFAFVLVTRANGEFLALIVIFFIFAMFLFLDEFDGVFYRLYLLTSFNLSSIFQHYLINILYTYLKFFSIPV